MARNQAIRKVVEAERRGNLWERRPLGYQVWPLERLVRYRQELLRDEMANSEGRRPPIVERIDKIQRPLLKSVLDLLEAAARIKPSRDIWVLSSSNYRRRDACGQYQCIYAEHLREQLGDRLLFIELNQADLPRQHREDLLFIDAVHLTALLSGKATAPILARTSANLAEERQAFAPTDINWIYQLAAYGRMVRSVAHSLIRLIPPQAVFVLCAYKPFIPFQVAVRESGIPLIELQHGVIHESHPGYILDDAPEMQHLPDHLVVFGAHFGELLERECPRWRGRWTIGGHPWLKRQRQDCLAGKGQIRDSVVVFSQNDPPAQERIRAILPELRSRLDPKLRLILKPHPRELDASAYYASAIGSGVELASPRDDSYQLLGRCRLSVTVYSTVAIEALAFDCRSVVIRSPYWNEDIHNMVAQESLIPANNADDIVAALSNDVENQVQGSMAQRLFGINTPEPNFLDLIDKARKSMGG